MEMLSTRTFLEIEDSGKFFIIINYHQAIKHDNHYSLSFRWFSVIIYMVFLFLVAVILTSLLIAQFNKSYTEITETARQTITPDRAKFLVKQQSTPSWAEFFFVRQKYMR